MHVWNWLFRILPAVVVQTGIPLHLFSESNCSDWLVTIANSSQIATWSSTVLPARTDSVNYCTHPRQSRTGDSSPRVQRRQGPPWRGQQVPDWLLSAYDFTGELAPRCRPCPALLVVSLVKLQIDAGRHPPCHHQRLSFDTSLRSSACAASCALIALHHDQSLRHN
jgi:hypothetical protein